MPMYDAAVFISIQGTEERANIHIDQHGHAEHAEATDDTVEDLTIFADCGFEEVHGDAPFRWEIEISMLQCSILLTRCGIRCAFRTRR